MRGRECETGAKVFTAVVPIVVIMTKVWPFKIHMYTISSLSTQSCITSVNYCRSSSGHPTGLIQSRTSNDIRPTPTP